MRKQRVRVCRYRDEFVDIEKRNNECVEWTAQCCVSTVIRLSHYDLVLILLSATCQAYDVDSRYEAGVVLHSCI